MKCPLSITIKPLNSGTPANNDSEVKSFPQLSLPEIPWILALIALFWLIGIPGFFQQGVVDSNGYESAAWMIHLGHVPYFEFIHSQGPIFLYWATFVFTLLGEVPNGFRIGTGIIFSATIALAWILTKRTELPNWQRTILVIGLCYSPPLLWQGWYVTGVSETAFGLLLAGFGLWGLTKPNAWIIGFAFAFVLSNRLLGAPVLVGFLICCLGVNRLFLLKTIAITAGFFLILMSPIYLFGGFDAWLNQSILYHFQKRVQFNGRWTTYLNNSVFLIPLLLPVAVILLKKFKPNWGMLVGLVLSLVLAYTQKIFITYYLAPALICAWFLILPHLKTINFRHLLITPMLAMGIFQGYAASQLPQDVFKSDYKEVCSILKNIIPENEPIFVESILGWQIYQCGPYTVWGGLTDNNLMVFQSLVDPVGLAEKLNTEKPLAIVLTNGSGLRGLKKLNGVFKKNYRHASSSKLRNIEVLLLK